MNDFWKMFIQFIKDISVIYYAKVFLLGSTITLLLIWFTAFFHGYHVIVTVNDYNEAYPELIMFIAAIPCLAILIWQELKNYALVVRKFKRVYKKKHHIKWIETL